MSKSSPPSQERTLWMFPRNKRTCFPFEVAMALRIISTALANNPNKPLSQSEQDDIDKKLKEFEISNGASLQSDQSGGYRTWVAYLTQMYLLYSEKISPRKKVYRLTMAGTKMAELSDPVKELRYSLARMQFPSPYSLSPPVKISESVNVRPVIFLQQLAQFNLVLSEGLYEFDIAIACIYGRNHDSHIVSKVVNKCMAMRTTQLKTKKQIIEELELHIDEPEKDLFTSRTRNREDETDSFDCKKRIKDVLDIANTLANRLRSSGIFYADYASQHPGAKLKYRFNPGVLAVLTEVSKERRTPRPKDNQWAWWSRRMGRGARVKDSRIKTTPKRYEVNSPQAIIKQKIARTYHMAGLSFVDRNELIRDLVNETQWSRQKIESELDKVLPEAATDLERQLYESATDGKKDRIFEKSIEHFLKFKFPSSITKHTGQETNPESPGGGYADVFFCAENHQCLIIDAKASQKSYGLPANHRRAMIDYIKNSYLLVEHETDAFAMGLFIANEAKEPSVSKGLLKMKKEAPLPIGFLRVRDFINVVNSCAPDTEAFIKKLETQSIGIWSHKPSK